MAVSTDSIMFYSTGPRAPFSAGQQNTPEPDVDRVAGAAKEAEEVDGLASLGPLPLEVRYRDERRVSRLPEEVEAELPPLSWKRVL